MIAIFWSQNYFNSNLLETNHGLHVAYFRKPTAQCTAAAALSVCAPLSHTNSTCAVSAMLLFMWHLLVRKQHAFEPLLLQFTPRSFCQWRGKTGVIFTFFGWWETVTTHRGCGWQFLRMLNKTNEKSINLISLRRINCKIFTYKAKQPQALLQRNSRGRGDSKVELMIKWHVWMYYMAHITRSMCVGEVLGDVSVPLDVWRGEDEEMEVGGTHCGW